MYNYMYVSRSLMHIKYLMSSPCPLCIYVITVFVYHSGLPNMASLTTIFAVYICFNLAYCVCMCVCSYTYSLSTMCVCILCTCMCILYVYDNNEYLHRHAFPILFYIDLCIFKYTSHISHLYLQLSGFSWLWVISLQKKFLIWYFSGLRNNMCNLFQQHKQTIYTIYILN